MANQKLTPEIESVLRAARIEGNKLFLTGQLSPQVYKKVKDFLLNVNAEWSRKEGCHIFKGDPNKLLFAIEEGVAVDEKKARQAFYTPLDLAEEVVQIADVKDKTVFEPSFGDGRFIKSCMRRGACWIDGIEIDKESYDKAQEEISELTQSLARANPNQEPLVHLRNVDFLTWELSENLNGQVVGYEVVLGNPPYHKNAFYYHTVHAYKFVKEGGKLVFILPNSIHSHKKFQEFVSDKKWEFRKVEAGRFKESGTLIETNIVTIWKQ
jgi:type I restriction-modification system DNA methylase subunit